MNTHEDPPAEETKKSERIAARIMRSLAILGLVAVLAGLAWIVVQGVRMVPQTGEAVSAAVSSISSLIRRAPEHELVFELETRSFPSGQPAELTWRHEGAPSDHETYTLSYSCSRDATLDVRVDDSWQVVDCGVGIELAGSVVSVLPTASEARLTDVELTIASGELKDTTLVTIVHAPLLLEDSEPAVTSTATGAVIAQQGDVAAVASIQDEPSVVLPVTGDVQTSTDLPATVEVPDTSVPAPTYVPAPVAPVPATPRTPADLVVNIEDTGVYVDVAGRDTFFSIDPVPSDTRAAVVFTVTNRGQLPSGAWAFLAELPIEGAPAYEYTSPAQNSLAPGMQVEFTLGFDEVQAGMGAITIILVPTNAADRTGNNTDVVSIEFE